MDGMWIASLVVDIGLLSHVMQVFFVEGVFFYLQRFPNQWPSPNSIIKQTCSVHQCSAPSSPTNKTQQILPCQKGDCKSTLQVQKWPPGFYRLALEEFHHQHVFFCWAGLIIIEMETPFTKMVVDTTSKVYFCLLRLECSGRVYQLTPGARGLGTDVSDACVFLSNESPKLLTFHCTGYFIGILKMVYYNPHIVLG